MAEKNPTTNTTQEATQQPAEKTYEQQRLEYLDDYATYLGGSILENKGINSRVARDRLNEAFEREIEDPKERIELAGLIIAKTEEHLDATQIDGLYSSWNQLEKLRDKAAEDYLQLDEELDIGMLASAYPDDVQVDMYKSAQGARIGITGGSYKRKNGKRLSILDNSSVRRIIQGIGTNKEKFGDVEIPEQLLEQDPHEAERTVGATAIKTETESPHTSIIDEYYARQRQERLGAYDVITRVIDNQDLSPQEKRQLISDMGIDAEELFKGDDIFSKILRHSLRVDQEEGRFTQDGSHQATEDRQSKFEDQEERNLKTLRESVPGQLVTKDIQKLRADGLSDRKIMAQLMDETRVHTEDGDATNPKAVVLISLYKDGQFIV